MVDASSARRECGLVSTNVLILRSESVVRQLDRRFGTRGGAVPVEPENSPGFAVGAVKPGAKCRVESR